MRAPKILTLLAAALMVASACQAAPSPTPVPATSAPGETTAPPAETPTPPPAEAVTLTLLEHQELRIKALKKVLPLFESKMEAEGKNIKVNLVEEVIPDEEFRTKVTVSYGGDNPPDVTSYPGAWVPDFATAGYLADITDLLAGWPDWEAHFYPILRERAQQADGRYYSMPRHGTVIEYFYRKDILEANGISTAQPQSWDELIQRLTDLHAKTGLPAVTLPAGTTWGGGTFDEGFIHVFNGTGGTLYDTATGKWVVKSGALVDAFTFYATLAQGDLLPTDALLAPEPWEPTKYDGFTGTLADGTAIPVAPPVTTQGSWGWIYDWGPNGARPIEDIFNKVGVWAFPSKEAGKTFVWAAEDWMWTISAKSRHQAEAFELLKFLNTADALAIDAAAVGNLAPRDDIRDVRPYAEMPYLIQMEELLPTGKSFKAQVGIDKIQQAVGQATEKILLGEMDGPQAADFFTQTATDLLGADKVEEQP